MSEIIILSIVQGITEFLPISSSSHLILISKYFEFNNSNLTLDVSLHFGSLIAIILYFREDLKKKNLQYRFIKKNNYFVSSFNNCWIFFSKIKLFR